MPNSLIYMTTKYITSILFLTLLFCHTQGQRLRRVIRGYEDRSMVWVADLGNDSFKNPILHADYSDPDAIRVGDFYYMTSSSFEDIPGLPILRSDNMVNWKIIGHALLRQPPY